MLLVSTVLFLLSAHTSLAGLPQRPVYHGPRTPQVDLSTTAPPSLPLPRSPYKQTSRQAIVARQREKEKRKYAKVHGKRQAAAAQASATVYPSCAGLSAKAAIQQTGFADLSPYYISRTAPYDVAGSWMGVKTALECIALCQQVGSACTGAYYDPNAGTCTQRTSGIPSGDMWASLAGGTMAVRGTCQQIAGAVRNATIMTHCCDNTPPANTVCADAAYQNVGQFCARAQRSLGGNTLSSSTVQATTARAGYTNCIAACVSASKTAYTQQTANAQCLGAVFDSNPPAVNSGLVGGLLGGLTGTTQPGPNCMLQGNALSSITTTSDTSVVAFMSGRCEEQNVGTGTYSASLLAIQGCNTDPELSFSS